jgi:hypothetical protein
MRAPSIGSPSIGFALYRGPVMTVMVPVVAAAMVLKKQRNSPR